MPQPIENVSVNPEANIYFDGRCVSHSLQLADGSRKSVGVIFPSSLTFSTGEPELMELIKGRCRIKREDEADWSEFGGGEQFSVAGNSRFDIETLETLHYICHFG
ncbi:MAG: pyrimidine/purine nucleoside phosphorylase [Gammaproteobacteria bacterium]|nr:pyrimidine/purine nucleoside phosphorylase [Gammaproteobacteria bacterium]